MLLLLLPQPAPHNDNHEGASGAANRKCESAKHIIIEKCSIFSPTGTFFYHPPTAIIIVKRKEKMAVTHGGYVGSDPS